MNRLVLRWFLFAEFMLMFTPVYAQTASEERMPPPTGKPPVNITLHYISVFSHYMPYKEQPVLSWQEANDKAGEIGGWRFYARESKQDDTEGTSLEPKPAKPKLPSLPVIINHQHHEHGGKP